MRGHIRQRRPGVWAVVLDLPRGADNKRNQQWITVNGTRRDAETKLGNLLKEANAGTMVKRTKLTLGEWGETWLERRRLQVQQRTIESYDGLYRRYISPNLGRVVLQDLRREQIKTFVVDLSTRAGVNGTGIAPIAVRHTLTVLSMMLREAVDDNLISANPADRVRPPRAIHAELAVLTPMETAELLRTAQGSSLHLPILIAAMTGLRRSEVVGLRWQDVDLENRRLTVNNVVVSTQKGLINKGPKSKASRRTIDLPQVVVAEMLALRANLDASGSTERQVRTARVCQTSWGNEWNPDRLSMQFHTLVVSTPSLPKIRFHDLRHTHAAQLIALNVHVKAISSRLGHASIGITMDIYGHLFPSMGEIGGLLDRCYEKLLGPAQHGEAGEQ
jgi:integrase